MLIQSPESWELPESSVTPENIYFKRRSLLKTLGFSLVAGTLTPSGLLGATAGFPSRKNASYGSSNLKPSDYELITGYNNYYEFTTNKQDVKNLAKAFKSEPWTLEVGGLCHRPQKFDVNQLVKQMGLEQRVYRFRCVEAWSMVVPWDGFPLNKLLKLVQPTSEAKFLKFTTFYDPQQAPGQKKRGYPWPYVEGLTLQEASHDLPLLVTGIYGIPLPNQNGALFLKGRVI